MKIALDTNILAYAEGVNGAAMRTCTHELLARLPHRDLIVPVQALGELFRVLVGKHGRRPGVAGTAIHGWSDAFSTVETSTSVMRSAVDLARDHGLSIWDSVILSAAAEAGCRLLLSEDLQDGFTWRGVTVVNPYAARVHPLLADVLAGD